MLETLCNQAFMAGFEGNHVVKEMLERVCDEVYSDRFGNIIGKKHGTSGMKILLDAHMDEIGLVVSGITDAGTLEFVSAGGIDPRILPGAEVTVHGKCELYGIIGAKPPHLLSEDDRKAAIKMKDLAIDVGYRNPSELVSVGDFVTFRPNCSNLAGDYVSSKALDNRAGVMAVLMAMKELSDCPHTVQVMLSTGEERGCVGASGGMFDLSADIAIVVDVTFGISPGCDEDCCFELGSGAAVCTGPNICKSLFDKIVKTAEENNIPYQIEVEGGDAGTNAGVIQLSNEGIATAMISIPIRYMHTPVEVVKRSDIENVSRLIAEVCKNA